MISILQIQLAGSAVQSVNAVGMTIFGPHEDLAHARLVFDNGCVALLQAARERLTATLNGSLDRSDSLSCRFRPTNCHNRKDRPVDLSRGEWDVSQISRNEQEDPKTRVFQDLIQP